MVYNNILRTTSKSLAMGNTSMSYKIRISYRTGNSFGSEDVEEDLEMTWENVCIK